MAVAGPSLRNVILVIGFLNAPVFLRLVRSEVLTFRERPVMEAARCVGNRNSGTCERLVNGSTTAKTE